MLKRVSILVIWCSVAVAGTCLAHTMLQSSSPADKSTVAAAPKTLTLMFSQTAQLAAVKLVHGAKEIPITLDKSAKAAQRFDLTLPAIGPGIYTVQWTAVASDDGHVTKGSFAFTVAG